MSESRIRALEKQVEFLKHEIDRILVHTGTNPDALDAYHEQEAEKYFLETGDDRPMMRLFRERKKKERTA